MKFVRTKDGVYKTTKNYVITPKGYVAWHDFYEPIIAQADTIEELCDEAIFFDKDNKPHYKSQEGNIWFLGASLFTETLRFGVFTDKGLIYVAKTNKKGKLELL